MSTPNIVIVSPELDIQNGLAGHLSDCGMAIFFASTVAQTEMILRNDHVSVIICAENLPDGYFTDIVSLRKGGPRKIPVIVFSPFADWAGYMKNVAAGAFDYLRYPSAQVEIDRIVRDALKHSPGERTFGAASAA